MELRIVTDLQDGILLVTASGDFVLDSALRVIKQVCETAADKQVNKILVNEKNVRGPSSCSLQAP
jgi:hypothetical protein